MDRKSRPYRRSPCRSRPRFGAERSSLPGREYRAIFRSPLRPATERRLPALGPICAFPSFSPAMLSERVVAGLSVELIRLADYVGLVHLLGPIRRRDFFET